MFIVHVSLVLKNSLPYILEEFMYDFERSQLTNLLSWPILGFHVLKNVNVEKRNSNIPQIASCQIILTKYTIYFNVLVQVSSLYMHL